MTSPDNGQTFPFLELCGITRPAIGEGHCIAVVEPNPRLLNSLGIAHGGLVSTLADAAMGGAARSCLSGARTVVTVNMQTSFFATARGRLEAEAKVVKQTRTLIFVECDVRVASGDVIGRASGVFRALDRDRFRAHRPPSAKSDS
jgi:uncharacterized protein (TIGR00369 family)